MKEECTLQDVYVGFFQIRFREIFQISLKVSPKIDKCDSMTNQSSLALSQTEKK